MVDEEMMDPTMDPSEMDPTMDPEETESPEDCQPRAECAELTYCNCMSGQAVAIMDDEGCPACACTDSSSLSYYYGEAGTVCDPWESVASEEECRSAAAVLGATYVPSLSFEDWTSPSGCIGDLEQGGEVMYNSNSNGSPSWVRRPVCSNGEGEEECRVVCSDEDDEELTTMLPKEPSADPTL